MTVKTRNNRAGLMNDMGSVGNNHLGVVSGSSRKASNV